MTTAKPNVTLDMDRLMVRIRRGDASVEERRAFEQALSASALLRLSHQMGRDFDDEARVRPGDDDLIARAASGAVTRRTRHMGKRRALLLGVAASLALATTAAATTSWLRSNVEARPPAPVPDQKSPSRAAALVSPAPHRDVETPSEPSRSPVVATPAAPSTTTHRDAPRTPVEPRSNPIAAAEESAAGLFREANAARRAGNFELARAHYTELQARYPETDEARVSRVSLGKLLLSAGRTREAERQFQSYLQVRGGNLDEEALVGRAEALGRLGESGEERRVWEVLLRGHPSTVYATRARQRLLELDTASPPDGR
jgi:TolA-binding protein